MLRKNVKGTLTARRMEVVSPKNQQTNTYLSVPLEININRNSKAIRT